MSGYKKVSKWEAKRGRKKFKEIIIFITEERRAWQQWPWMGLTVVSLRTLTSSQHIDALMLSGGKNVGA